jgi:hypothetical protein
MINATDLIRGLIALMDTPPEDFASAQLGGVPIAGFSFSPEELFAAIRRRKPGFSVSYDSRSNPMAAVFAATWPDSLGTLEAFAITGFKATLGLEQTIDEILKARESEH